SRRTRPPRGGGPAGGGAPGPPPEDNPPPFAGVGVLELVQSVQRRQRRLRHGSTPSLDVGITNPVPWRARGCLRAWRGAPRNPASPAPPPRSPPPWASRAPPLAPARPPRPP